MTAPLRGLLRDRPGASRRPGASMFADALRDQAVRVTETDWQPPLDGTAERPARRHGRPAPRRRERACPAADDGRRALTSSTCVRLTRRWGSSAGPSCTPGRRIEWERASGPLQGRPHRRDALRGAGRHRGGCRGRPGPRRGRSSSRATTATPWARWRASISPSMWVYELRDEVHDHTSWCSLNEGLGKVLRYGAYGPEVIDRLHWMNSRARADAAAGDPRRRPDRRASRSSPRCSRWATRATTATAPGR